jgi:Zn-dependent peptidase ImmA (M78 family)/DNA-binding XRE family transcriptional regulator
MAANQAEAIGRRIREARGRSGLTQADLASAVQIDRSGLTKIETGGRGVSALELARIADALDERIEWFLEDAPPALVSRRNMHEAGAPNAAIDQLIERLARNIEFLVAHEQLELPQPKPLGRPASHTAMDKAAAEARSMLGLGAAEPVLDLGTVVERVGLLAFSFELEDAADGASILLDRGGIALVNGTLHVGRRRLTLAHELGHYLFADDYTIDWQSDDADANTREARIDRFARALLLPEAGVASLWTETRDREGLRIAAVRTASDYRVDMSTLARRLQDLRLVNRAEAQRVREVRTGKADIIELNLLVPDELRPPTLPAAVVAAVLRLYRSEVVSAARALDLLLDTWDEDDLPELSTLPEGAIWKFVS